MSPASRRHAPPPMSLEGVLGPNSRIDDAEGFAVAAPQALAVTADESLLFSTANAVSVLGEWGQAPQPWAVFEHAVTALCCGPQGQVAIGFANGGLVLCGPNGEILFDWGRSERRASVADCLFLDAEEIAIVDHGYASGDDVLSLAPWDDQPRGQVVALTPSGGERQLASGLHCPMGICRDKDGALIVTELEHARIVGIDGTVRRAGFPGYLGRLRRTGAGFTLTCLARRDPLIEFIKTEKKFVAEMKERIAPRHWISPRTHPEFSHDFPIELGATRLFGEIKPWAPSFSYGLIVEMDENLLPVASAHSRANGARHAVSDALCWQKKLIAVSTASGEVLNLGPVGASA